jgi:hypothetical protein
LRHLLLDQALPRAWAQLGFCVLHASAVQLESGSAIAFMGNSGAGKSTIAAALQARGCSLVSDDCLSVAVAGGQPAIVPSYRGQRLNRDSLRQLKLLHQVAGTVTQHSNKMSLKPTLAASFGAVPLEALYLIGSPGAADAGLSLTPCSASDFIAAMLTCSFVLDVTSSSDAARQLALLGGVVNTLPAMGIVNYPRDFQLLGSVCDFLLNQGQPEANFL